MYQPHDNNQHYHQPIVVLIGPGANRFSIPASTQPIQQLHQQQQQVQQQQQQYNQQQHNNNIGVSNQVQRGHLQLTKVTKSNPLDTYLVQGMLSSRPQPRRTSLPVISEIFRSSDGEKRKERRRHPRLDWGVPDQDSDGCGGPHNKGDFRSGYLRGDGGNHGGGGGGNGRPFSSGHFPFNFDFSWPSYMNMFKSQQQQMTQPVQNTTSPTSSVICIMPQCDSMTIPTESGPMVLQLVLPKNSDSNQGSLVPASHNKELSLNSSELHNNSSSDGLHTPATNTCTTVSTVSGSPVRPEHPLGIINVEHKPISLPTPELEKKEIFRKNLTTLLSCIYAIFIVMFGGVIYVADILQPKMSYGEIFTIYLTIVGTAWLGFLHFDIRVYLTSVVSWIKQERMNHSKGEDNPNFNKSMENISTNQNGNDLPKSPSGVWLPRPAIKNSYTFKTGPHSGSFYLKIGAAVFCFGHLIHEGLLLSRQIAYFTSENKLMSECADTVSLILQIIHPVFSFYQLFMVFKYSNIVIHRYKETARFAIMHIIAANLCLWVNTIIRETEEALAHKKSSGKGGDEEAGDHFANHFNNTSKPSFLQTSMAGHGTDDCVSKTILSSFTMQAAPYLYPFTIEYSLLQVGVWFIVWYNIGSDEEEGDSPFINIGGNNTEHSEEGDGISGEFFSSNLVIHVDCHSANRGLFAGLFILLATVVSVIIFFVAMTNDDYIKTGIIINNVSDTILMLLMIFSAAFAYRQTALLDINEHAVTFLDNFLLFVALPCFFLYAIFNVVASIAVNNPFNVVISILCVIQVVIQTPFIVDGLRRCSNSYMLRFKKPGREIITFLVVCNVAAWILETFEIKSYEAQADRIEFYGSFVWTLLSHVTLPLTLFYRFHSSVCLVDMWKSAYEQGD